MRVLIVDDDDIALDLLENTLTQAGYEVVTARNGKEALEIIRGGDCRLVISDWEMPEMNGIELCKAVRERPAAYVYLILVTSRDSTEDVIEGLNAGADDFITKPYEPTELCVRLRAGERMLLLDSRDLTIFALAKLAESRDPETGAHLERVRDYCQVIAEHLSNQAAYRDVVDGQYVQSIYLTCPLHDIGKVGIPDRVLLKPGRLSEEEFEQMKLHTVIGANTLDSVAQEHPEAEFLKMARDIALTHHERFDGTGYPAGLVGEEIPLCGRIMALADVYDALTTKRVYKEAFTHEDSRSIILAEENRHFDPDIIKAFVDNEERFIRIRQQFSSQMEHEILETENAATEV